MNDKVLRRFRKAYWQAFRGLETLRLQQWERSKVTLPQLRVLFTVRRTPGILTTELAHQLGTTVPTASGVVSKLVARGLIERTKAVSDRRQAPLHLTNDGAALAGELLTVVDPFLTRVGALVGDDIQAVTETLERVAAIAESVRDELAKAGTSRTLDGLGSSWDVSENATASRPARSSAVAASVAAARSTGRSRAMADEPVLKYETRENGRIVIMTLNRPDRMNALNSELREAIAESWERFAKDDDAWVAIVTGAGRAFCAGNDLRQRRELAEGAVEEHRPREQHWSYPLAEGLELWKPIIAAVNGFALAGGFNLAMQCDIRIAAEEAEFGIAESRWNRSASWLHNLTRQMPLQQALELAMWGDARLSAKRAYEIGWVNRVVPQERLMDEALSWAERSLRLAPRAVRNFKQVLYRSYSLSPETGRAFSTMLQRDQQGMEDSKEGLRAFAEKRPPVFRNR